MRHVNRANKTTSSHTAAEHIAVKPAAGPLTLKADLLISEIMIPPIIPTNNPVYKGVPKAREIPRQRGKATNETVMLAFRSFLKL